MNGRNQTKQIHNPLDMAEGVRVLDAPVLQSENKYKVPSAQRALCGQPIHCKPPLWRITTTLPKAAHALCHTTTQPSSSRIANAHFVPWKVVGCG